MFRIHDILVWIRIHGSMPLTNNPDPAIFVIDLQDGNKKRILLKCFSVCYFLKVHLHIFSKIKSLKEATKQNSRNQGFSYYFCLLIEGSGSEPKPYLWLMGPDPVGLKLCGSGGSGSGTLRRDQTQSESQNVVAGLPPRYCGPDAAWAADPDRAGLAGRQSGLARLASYARLLQLRSRQGWLSLVLNITNYLLQFFFLKP